MREIKFRGKRLNYDVGEWVYGSLVIREQDVHGTPGYFISLFGGEWVPVDPETVGQYTGLKDESSKEIYEGDLLSNGDDRIAEVVWQECDFNIHMLRQNGIDVSSSTLLRFYVENGITFWEVIGNIYDNPHLLDPSAH